MKMETVSAATLNKEQLASSVSGNETALIIAKDWASRQRIRHEIDLDRYLIKLLNKGHKVVTEDFWTTFKNWDKMGVGSLVHGRGQNPNRFKLYYSLKNIGNAIVTPDKPVTFEKLGEPVAAKPKIVRRRRKGKKLGRPFGSKNRPKLVHSSGDTVKRMSAPTGAIFSVKTLDGGAAGISVEEAFRIADQVNQIRAITTKASA